MGVNDGGSAFPWGELGGGMTLRDWFAGQALAGILSTNARVYWAGLDPAASAATVSYRMADAMLKAREG